jgi:Saxitoxin biosynthesis operon protein SxtJ
MEMPRASLHEDFQRKQEGEGGSDRGFGIVFTIFFSLVGLLPLRAHRPVRGWALAVAALFLVVALLQPAWLGPLNQLWTKLGVLLGRVVSPVITGLLFFLVVTPIGLVFRLSKKDPLRLASNAKMSTYWIARQPPGPAPETMRSQF